MLSIAHAVTGAYIASALPYPIIYIPLVFISHYILDHIAHFDVGTGMKKSKRKLIITLFFTALDLLAAFLLIVFFWQQSFTNIGFHLWIGALLGIFPDVLEASNLFFHRKIPFLRPLYDFHEHIHRSTTNLFWGLFPQAIVVLYVLFLIHPR